MMPQESTIIRAVGPSDCGSIAALYNHYIQNTCITFEEEPVTAEEIATRLQGIHAAGLPWIVAEHAGALVGYAYASPWRTRSAYRFSLEVTVYLAPEMAGFGLGTKLYAQLLPTLAEQGFHSAIGGIALPNAASIALHEKFGFKKVAHFPQVGFKRNSWIDVGYWQRIF